MKVQRKAGMGIEARSTKVGNVLIVGGMRKKRRVEERSRKTSNPKQHSVSYNKH